MQYLSSGVVISTLLSSITKNCLKINTLIIIEIIRYYLKKNILPTYYTTRHSLAYCCFIDTIIYSFKMKVFFRKEE